MTVPRPTLADVAKAAAKTTATLQRVAAHSDAVRRGALSTIRANLNELATLAKTLDQNIDASRRAYTWDEMTRRVGTLAANIAAGLEVLTTTQGLSDDQPRGILEATKAAKQTSELLAAFIINTIADSAPGAKRRKEDAP